MNTENKKPGGRPKLASYQKRTRCFRIMFNESDYIYIQRRAWNFPGAGIPDGEKDPENHAGTRKRIKGCMFSGKTGILFPI